jgi:hypothetical protein
MIEHNSKSKIKSSLIANKIFMNLDALFVVFLAVGDEYVVFVTRDETCHISCSL